MSDQQSEFSHAIATVTAEPENMALWSEVEELAAQLDAPENVATAYRTCLADTVSAQVAVDLGKRAARFHEEWFGDDREGLVTLLSRVMELNPQSDWAFQQLTVVLTVAEKWDEAIALYEGAIARTEDKPKLIRLLDEAYQVTKDLANRPDQAVDFLKAKLAISPSPKQLEVLERLLERHGRWADLIELWRDALDGLSDAHRCSSLTKIAETHFDKLQDGVQSLSTLAEVFSYKHDNEDSLVLLERIVTSESIDMSLREKALDMVRDVFNTCERPRDIVRVLADVLPLCGDEQRIGMHAELGKRLSDLEEHGASLDHYAALLVLDPGSVATQRALRREAQLTDRFDRYASALASAADGNTESMRRVALLIEAANTLLEIVDDETQAIDLLLAAMATEGIKSADVLNVGKKLNSLLERAERSNERVSVLEQLAGAETVPSSRRALVGDLAKLSEELGDVDRALSAWRTCIETDAGDLRALESLIELLRREERWTDLIGALGARTEQEIPENQKRSDFIAIANIYEEKLQKNEEALATWRNIQQRYGEDPEIVAALSRLLTALENWADLTLLLENSNAQQVAYLADQFASLGNAYRLSLGDNERAIECYKRSLTVDLAHSGARDGLSELLQSEDTRNAAAEAMVHSLRGSNDLDGLLELVDARIAGTEDVRKHAEILLEAADISHNTSDRNRTLGYVTRLFPLSPRDRALEDRMVELAQTTGEWDGCLRAMGQAQDALLPDAFAIAQMRLREAILREDMVADNAGALQCYLQVVAALPDHHEALASTLRLAGLEGRFDEMTVALLNYVRERGVIPSDLWTAYSTVANAGPDNRAKMTQALFACIPNTGLTPRNQAELYWRMSSELLMDEAEPRLQSLLLATQLDSNRSDTYLALAQLQRAVQPSDQQTQNALYKTLRRLCEIDSSELSHFVAAAEVALESLERLQQYESLSALQARATAAWRGSAPSVGDGEPEVLVTWAIEKLVESYVADGGGQQAIDLLIDSSRLPFAPEVTLGMRKQAARIAVENVNDPQRAIDMYRAILSQAPRDTATMTALGEIYQMQGSLPDLLGLKRRDLQQEEDQVRRLALRLEIAGIINAIDEKGGRLELLRDNLRYAPGHPASTEAAVSFLTASGRFIDLADLLEEQANALELAGETALAANLWQQLATIAEEKLKDVDRALSAYRKVATLAPSFEALDSLATLYIDRGLSGAAVPFLQQALELGSDSEKIHITQRLAQAHLTTGHPKEAIVCLREATDGVKEPVVALRSMLAGLYRESEKWAELAETLTQLLQFQSDEVAAQTGLEAAKIYHERLQAPHLAIPALTSVLSASPTDRSLRLMMAKSQRLAGHVDVARGILEPLIAEFGRRRSKERAAVHVELAHVARAEGTLDVAMSELEQASKMDVGNAHILLALADLCRELGDTEQAERSLRALLLIVRRQPPGESESDVGMSEVLYELHHIAEIRGDESQSAELLESVIEAAASSDAEVRRLRKTLLEYKNYDLLAKTLRARIGLSKDRRAKAQLLGYVAELLTEHLEDPKGALQARLDCLSLHPSDDELHNKAYGLAKELNAIPQYLECLEVLVTQQRRASDVAITAVIHMRAGALAENELGDFARARKHYTSAKNCNVAPADALFSLARVCGELGDSDAQTVALDELTTLAMADGPGVAQADALYRLAELQVVQANMVDRGLVLLEKALLAEPRYRQAAITLQTAAGTSNNAPEVMRKYGEAARQCGDKSILLDYLEREAQGDATAAQIREAVKLASGMGEHERSIVLLERALQAARSNDSLRANIWAGVELATHYGSVGRFSEAKDLLFELDEIADPEQVMSLGLELADKCQASNKQNWAAVILEFLREKEPGNRDIWVPLLELYRQLDSGPELLQLVEATLPTLLDLSERTAMRLTKANYLIDRNQDEAAIEVLRDACMDDPDSIEAANVYETVLRKEGNERALSDFMWQRFTEAKERGNPEAVIDVAIRLTGLLDQIDGDALTVLKQALEVAPSSLELLQAVHVRMNEEHDTMERCALLERLIAVEAPETASSLAQQLYQLRESLQDTLGMQRALEVGYQANPEDEAIGTQLEQWYLHNEAWQSLATLKKTQASQTEDEQGKVLLLRQVATLYRDNLSDLQTSADILAQAQEVLPNDSALALEVAAVFAAIGKPDSAIECLAASLAHLEGKDAMPLLLLRAEILGEAKRWNDAIENLSSAYLLDRETVHPLLVSTLESARVQAVHDGELAAERDATMRLIALFDETGDEDAARGMLITWIERDSTDVLALSRLRDMEERGERWIGVVSTCTHLVGLQTGEEQVKSALLLADAASKIDSMEHGTAGLERTHEEQPDNAAIRNRLIEQYTTLGARAQLAYLLVTDAGYCEDEDTQYEKYCSAAAIFVNELGDCESAVIPAQKAKELRPEDHETVVLLADVLIASEQMDQAIAMLDPAIASHKRRSPQLAELQYRMAKVAAAQGDDEGQLTWLKKAFDVNRKDGLIASELATIASNMGDYDLALKPLRAITLMEDPKPVSRVMALLWEAKIENVRGNRAKAELWAKKALREDPQYTEAEEFLTELAEQHQQ